MGSFVITAQNLLNSAPILGLFTGNGYRPPNWSQPQITSITVVEPAAPTEAVSHNIDFGTGFGPPSTPTIKQSPTTPASTTYFFDAVMRADHSNEMRITEHPIQSGAAISDHAYALPSRVVLEIAMSDAMDSFVSGQYSDFATKSISAYQKLLELKDMRVPLTLTTRLNTYNNMLIEELRASDDIRTLHGLRASVRFKQIIVGTVSVTTQSARPNVSSSSNPGTSQPQAVDQALKQRLTDGLNQWSSHPVN